MDKVILDRTSYEALLNAEQHGAIIQLCSVGDIEEWSDFREWQSKIGGKLQDFPSDRYRAVIRVSDGIKVPDGWRLTHIDDPETDGYIIRGPGVSYCAWKDKEPWLYLFCEALATTPWPEPTQQWTPSGIEYNRAIHHNPDAKAWADLFMQTFPHCGADPETMHGWFANAMMAMHDHLKSKQPAQQGSVPDGWRECLQEMVQAMHDYEMSVDEDAPYKHRSMMDRAHALLSTNTTPQQSGEWVRCSDRLPTEADADCDQEIWFCWSNNTVERRHYKRVQLDIHHDCYWMPTGLKRPNPPKQRGER